MAAKRLTIAGLLARALAGGLVLATVACSSSLDVYKQNSAGFFFPELLPDTVPVSPPLSSLGAIYGHVQDPNGFPLPGATITNGAAETLSSDGVFAFPTREYDATDNPTPVVGVDAATLSEGDFVLDGLPLGDNTLTVSFDEAKTFVPVYVGASSFSALVDPAAHIGPPNYQASIADPVNIVVPFYRAVSGSDGLRVTDVEPPTLQGQIALASGSAPVVSWPSGSQVSIVLRVTPPASATLQVASASIVYQDQTGNPLPNPNNPNQNLQVIKNISPEVTCLPASTKVSGQPATVVLDLSNSDIASDDVSSAQISFVIQDPNNPSVFRDATDPRGQVLTATVPIHWNLVGTP